MSAMFLWWLVLLAVLAMLMHVDIPRRLRLFALFAFVLTVWFLWGWAGAEFLADLKWPQPAGSSEGPTARLGQVGDLFGGINALFAALAFAGVALAALQQAQTTKIAFKQSIEATFFSALQLHHRIADSLQFDPDEVAAVQREHRRKSNQPRAYGPVITADNTVKGREVFDAVLKWIAKDRLSQMPTYQATLANYRTIQTEANFFLGHYFRNLYQLLKLVDEDEALDKPSRQKYASILRAQLSADELALLMVNCAYDMVDQGQFLALLVRYRMLEHLPLTRDDDEYVLTTPVYRVVLADAVSIQQYLVEPQVTSVKKVYRGAFGSNPAI